MVDITENLDIKIFQESNLSNFVIFGDNLGIVVSQKATKKNFDPSVENEL